MANSLDSWQKRAVASIAQGCLTFSKAASQYIEGVTPTHAISGYGPAMVVENLQGNQEIVVDFVCGLGSNLLDVRNNFSLPSTQEVILAERIKVLFPCIEKLKFLKTGTGACDAAVRIARAYTGKALVWGTGYHGSSDIWVSNEDPGVGTFYQFYQKFPNLENLIINLRNAADNLAAVIIEPVQLDMGVRAQLEEIRRLCTENKVVLIHDEVITGFRFLDYSVSNHFNIQPDLICLGKALGNGAAISIVGGRDEIMETEGLFISNTHNGELSGIASALQTLDALTRETIQSLWDRGEAFQFAFNKLTPKLRIVGYPTRGELQGEYEFKALFMQEMIKRGYFFGRGWFISHAHTTEILAKALEVAGDVVAAIDADLVKLEGLAPRPIFKRN
jgi:glutamate-1-semialdehyde aminotransferase